MLWVVQGWERTGRLPGRGDQNPQSEQYLVRWGEGEKEGHPMGGKCTTEGLEGENKQIFGNFLFSWP
jgi:hypothetical protein